MAKKDKKTKAVKEPVLSKKELKAKAKAEAEAKLLAEQEAQAKSKKKGKSGKKTDSAKSGKKSKAPANTEWDEDDSAGGGDFFKVETGKHLCRVRSVISVGQCQFEFQGKKDTKATSGIALVAEVWPYKVDKKKGKVVITSKEPAIVQGVVKALKGNAKSNYAKMLKSLGIKHISEVADMPCGIDVYTSDKGYMYLRSLHDVGVAEAKAVPKLTQGGYLVPNLDCMTEEAMKELNPITQVKDYVLQATNYPGSEAEAVVEAIRKDKPDFAKLKEKEDDGKGKATGKKKKGKKKKLDHTTVY